MTDKKVLKLALEYLRDNQHYIADNERHVYVMEYNAFVERLEALIEQPGVKQDLTPEQPAQQYSTCNNTLREQGKTYPRTCKKCGLGPCIADRVQPAQQQEPVAWGVDWGNVGNQSCVSIIKRLPDGGIEVLATEYGPPASKPLTDEQWQGIADTLGCFIIRQQKEDIEAILGIKGDA